MKVIGNRVLVHVQNKQNKTKSGFIIEEENDSPEFLKGTVKSVSDTFELKEKINTGNTIYFISSESTKYNDNTYIVSFDNILGYEA